MLIPKDFDNMLSLSPAGNEGKVFFRMCILTEVRIFMDAFLNFKLHVEN